MSTSIFASEVEDIANEGEDEERVSKSPPSNVIEYEAAEPVVFPYSCIPVPARQFG